MGCPEPKVGILMPIPFLNPPHYPIEMARAPVFEVDRVMSRCQEEILGRWPCSVWHTCTPKWWFPKIGLPPVITHILMGFSMKSTNHFGIPLYGNPNIGLPKQESSWVKPHLSSDLRPGHRKATVRGPGGHICQMIKHDFRFPTDLLIFIVVDIW